MHPRKKIGLAIIIIVGIALGYVFKNVKIGLIIGLAIGLLAGGLLSGK